MPEVVLAVIERAVYAQALVLGFANRTWADSLQLEQPSQFETKIESKT